MSLALRRAELADREAMGALAMRAKASWGYPPAWLAAWAAGLTFTAEMLEQGHYIVLEDETGAIRACGGIAPEAEGWSLEHCWVEPDWQGRGLGHRLVQALCQRAQQRGVTQLWIESDPHAEAFYRKLGARFSHRVARPVLGEARQLPVLCLPLPLAE
ncbi:GNAT family N-acetyltransferase [Leeia sp.]|uniref:GNAT family N-acetyltransferase n=1 Tax=Leeia sp. TaxID=2884678 RepID=UPI0035AD8DE2